MIPKASPRTAARSEASTEDVWQELPLLWDPDEAERFFWRFFDLEKFARDWRQGVGRRRD